jgi:hypothetical protein
VHADPEPVGGEDHHALSAHHREAVTTTAPVERSAASAPGMAVKSDG